LNVAKRILIFLSILNLSFAAEHKLVASDPAMDDHLGISVAVSGDYAIVGSWEDDDAGFNSGSAYIFNRDPGTGNWVQTAKLLASDAAESDRFGCSVDMHGDYAIVGAFGNSHPTYGMGAAYIFQKDAGGEDWLQRAKLVAYDASGGDQFGFSVAIDLDYALAGANYDDDGYGNSGSAYVFKRDAGLQSWSLKDKLTETNASLNANFGISVDLFEGYALVGSYMGTTESALIFKKDTGAETWTEQAVLVPADWSAGDEFGYAVALSADYAVVGARYEDYSASDNAGAAYIFKRNTGLETWSEMTKLRASDVASGGSQFGAAVAILNRQVIVGSHNAGKAYLYDRETGQEAWTETAVVPQNTISGAQAFGTSVGLSGSFLICGAPDDDESYINSGSAYLIDQSDFSLPVELSSFTAQSKQGTIELTWITSSEIENLGFILERKENRHPEQVEDWQEIASFKTHLALSGQGSTTRQTIYHFSDKSVAHGIAYDYRLGDVDYQGKLTLHPMIFAVAHDKDQAQQPIAFEVNSLYPNPFNPRTTLNYTLDQNMRLSISILDIRGRLVKSLLYDQRQIAGLHQLGWDGMNSDGLEVAGGIYFFNIEGPGFSKAVQLVKLD
jgi:hypothetical protein